MDFEEISMINLILGDRYKKSYRLAPLYFSYIEESRQQKIGTAQGNHLIGRKDVFLHELSYVRHAHKAIFIRFSILKEFEERYRDLSGDKEDITGGNEIIKGEERFVGKSLCAIFFVELVATRMKLLSCQGSSSIFHQEDRQLLQIEASCLIMTATDIVSRPRFGEREIFDGSFSENPAIIDGEREVFIDALNLVELGIAREDGKHIFSVSTQDDSSRSIVLIDTALEKLRKQRQKILGGIEQ